MAKGDRQRVREWVASSDGPFTTTEVAEATGVSADTTSNTLHADRRKGIVRQIEAGTSARPSVWKRNGPKEVL